MKRREFMEKTGFCAAGIFTPSTQEQTPRVAPSSPRREYKLEIEVVEAAKAVCYKAGQKFSYPQDLGKICPWLRDSLSGFLRALETGAVLSWKYKGTPYEKVIDPNGVTTEFVRCPDPTSAGIVVKITRTAV